MRETSSGEFGWPAGETQAIAADGQKLEAAAGQALFPDLPAGKWRP